jgi:hypothetical protein
MAPRWRSGRWDGSRGCVFRAAGLLRGGSDGSPTITLGVYGHLFSNTDDQAAQIMERAFGRIAAD